MVNCNLKYFCEQCGDCLECNAEFDCVITGDNHGEQLSIIKNKEYNDNNNSKTSQRN